MKRTLLLLPSIWVCLLVWGAHTTSAAQALPDADPSLKVAEVNGEPITWFELSRVIAASHTHGQPKSKAGRIEFTHVLQRMINTRLIVLEARNIGLHQTPGLAKAIQKYADQLQMEMLLEQHVENIQPDPETVEQIYASIVREWKIRSLRIKKETDAKKIDAQLKAGQDFEQIFQKAMQWRYAEGDTEGVYLRNNQLKAPVARVIAKMKAGEISPVLSLGKDGFIVFKLEGSRIPANEDVRARRMALQRALNDKRVKATRQYFEALKKAKAQVNSDLFDALDYEAEEQAMEKLLDDQRVLVEIQGAQDITVAEFSRALNQRFFHGIKLAVEAKRLNKKKATVLEDLLQKRLLRLEAEKRQINKSAAFEARVKEYENSRIFEAFIKKVVVPDIQLSQKELEAYYQKNISEFTSSRMMRIKDLVFAKRDDAVAAMQKLNKGTDFAWLSANAHGQVPADTRGLLDFEGRPLTVNNLPEDIRKAVSGAAKGDCRLYTDSDGHFYLLYVDQIIAPVQQSFADVKEDIAKVVFDAKVKESVERWAGQLAKFYPVKIYRSALAKLK
ncbi:MAG: peptidyl-prolyl cis-trans isomerase [Desulfobacteraceae bacterium]